MLSPKQARIHEFQVVPSLPEPLKPLMDIARNLWWTWTPDAVELFVRIDRDLWHEAKHNPVIVLGSCPQSRLEALAADESYLSAIGRVHEQMSLHLSHPRWFQKQYPEAEARDNACIAYFCAEFGLTECLQSYSGGLGILAGDHLKSASDLGLPLVGIGLLYRNGYFQQYLNADGWQQEFYPDLDFTNLPLERVRGDDGEKLEVTVELPGRSVNAAVWEAQVGRIRLLLMDTDVESNEPADRNITSQLYGGDMEMRIKQEIVLGIGGRRLLAELGYEPTVRHMNEGHAAFSALEHIRMLIEKHDMTFDEARRAGAAGNLFTTHTPVPAGIDRFPRQMIEHYLKEYHKTLRIDMENLLALGRENVFNPDESFSMAVLALRTSDQANGVAELHGKVSRKMWANIWPNVPNEEVPIGHVTNGVHGGTWISPDMVWLLNRYLPMDWISDRGDPRMWEAVDHIPDEELWRVHERRRQKLVRWMRTTHRDQLERRGAPSEDMDKCDDLFDHRALTIGFARRFATYKRAALLFRDVERLTKLLTDEERPLQIVVAGKAHPADTQGKELIRHIVHFAREHGMSKRVVFIENYNIAVARYMVQGVDVWLNNPRRPMEASGTSGMKAALNGVLNCSVLDGWWDEAWQKDIGWAIGRGETYDNYDYQDQVESEALYNLLEKQIVPMFYDRTRAGVPKKWVQWMKRSLREYGPRFNSNRMIREYTEKYYMPAHERAVRLCDENFAGARDLAGYIHDLRRHWHHINIRKIDADVSQPLGVHKPLEINAEIELNSLSPADVKVQVYYGPIDGEGNIIPGTAHDMQHAEKVDDGVHRYTGKMIVPNSGRHGFAIRVIPGGADLASPFIPGLITWDYEPEPAVSKVQPVTVKA
ncbi:MAG: alpha-glucan family phosphorylase [Phycisphaera sp.]|nr:alpha-glucan family phosphorylase [Phycisphaera sp.]